jgi:hypothetical protein
MKLDKSPCRLDHSFDLLTPDCTSACRAIANPSARSLPRLSTCGEALSRAQDALRRGDYQQTSSDLESALYEPGAWQ